MTKMNQMCFDSMQATRAVEIAEALFESYACGFEPPYTMLAEAEDLGLNVDAIKEKVEELYGCEEEDSYDFD